MAETVALLFADLVGSTQLLAALGPDTYADVLAAYRRTVEEAALAEDGEVVDHEGDGIFVVLPTAAGALRAAATAQRGLSEHAWPDGVEVTARIGVHVGEVQHHDSGYIGLDIHHAARVGAAADATQVLLTGRTWELARDSLDGELDAADLGEHRLRDVPRPVRLYQLTGPGLSDEVTAPRTLSLDRHNLPAQLTSFVGREREVADVAAMIAGSRLVTLTGVGGSGKTRLAVEVAREAAADLPDGSWLVELAAITEPARLMSAIGDVWGLRPGEGASIEDVVHRYLWSRELLLVIDNCEHLLDAAAAAIRSLLDACPRIRIIATSRESLGIPGEAVLRVPSLGLPDGDQGTDEAEAVRLFLDRARAVRPDLAPDADELRAIERICRRIDGIPLGIELAAARLRSMSAGELAGRLEESFRILSGSAKTALPRQRTLAATLDWSYQLLEEEVAALFRRLAVFTGGFTLAAAEAICADDDGSDVLDHLDSLVDRSLVVTSHHPDRGTRYRLLEPVRQYAQERLSDAGESAALQVAHAEHFARFAAEASPHLRGPDHPAWAARLDDDYPNLRATLTTLLETDDLDRYLDTAFDLFVHWMHTGRHLEGIDVCMVGVDAAPETTDPLRLVKACWVAASLGAEITRPQSVEHAREGLAIAAATEDPNAIGRMEMQLGAAIRHSTNDPDYLGHLHEGRRLLDSHPEPLWWEPVWERGFLNFVLAAYLPGDDGRKREHYDVAEASFEEVGDQAMLAATLIHSLGLREEVGDAWVKDRLVRALTIFGTLHSPYWHGHGLMYLGLIHHLADEHEAAVDVLEEGARRLEESGDIACWGTCNRLMGLTEVTLGATTSARERLGAVIDAFPALPMQEIVGPRTLDLAAEVLLAGGEDERAARVLGKVMSVDLPPSPLSREDRHPILLRSIADRIGPERTDRLVAEGAVMDVGDLLADIRGWISA